MQSRKAHGSLNEANKANVMHLFNIKHINTIKKFSVIKITVSVLKGKLLTPSS